MIEIKQMENCNIKIENEFNTNEYINNFVESIVNDKTKDELQFRYEFKILPYGQPVDGKEIFRCPMCDLDNIQGRKELTEHLHNHQVQHRSTEGRHMCCLCSKELSSNSSLERHLLTHSNHRPYDCIICGKKFTTNGNLSRHMKASHSTIVTPDKIDIVKDTKLDINKATNKSAQPINLSCTKPITTPIFTPNEYNHPKSLFLKLLENTLNYLPYLPIMNNYNYIKPENDILNLSLKTEPTNTSYFIRNLTPSLFPVTYQDAPLDLSINKKESLICKKESNSFLSTRSDIDDVSDSNVSTISYVTTTNNNKENDKNLASKIKKNSYKDAPKLIRCPIIGCAQKFPWNSSLMRHILTHTAHKPFKCIRCPKCFSTKSNRERHMHRVHGIQAHLNHRRHQKNVEKSSVVVKSEVGSIMSFSSDDGVTSQQNGTEFLSEQEWREMSSNDRQAENISHSLLKQAGQPVIEPNPLRKSQIESNLLRKPISF